MEEALHTLRPLRKVNSLPGSLADPLVTYEYPSCIDEALNAPRQSFSTYDKGMLITSLSTPTVDEDGHDIEVTTAQPDNTTPLTSNNAAAMAHAGPCSTAVLPAPPTEGSMTDEDSSTEGSDNHPTGPREQQPEESSPQQHHQLTAEEPTQDKESVEHSDVTNEERDADGQSEEDADREVVLHNEEEEAKVSATATTTTTTPPPLTAAEECVAYDPALMKEWLVAYRDCHDQCPAGIAAFLGSLPCNRGKAGDKKTPASGTSLGFPAFGTRLGQAASPLEASAALPGSSFATSQSYLSGRHALEALGDIWEDRKETPIAVNSAVRHRGLFGGAEKKELHQMVISVLNKVTSDPVKFREVKNELLRLPIPEATPEQLDDVVDIFFNKAVHEQHFSQSYAALIAALCKVPRGQHITGDKTLSLEYRLRQSLVRRCQREFVAGCIQESDADEETTKERRERMVGNVRFVCELFLLSIVSDTVITSIFVMCCTGTAELSAFVMPPTYTPSEAQVDEIIAAIQAAGRRYFQTQYGRQILPALMDNLRYWTQKHPVSRCRFILMSVIDTLQRISNDLASGAKASSPPPSSVLPGPQALSPPSTNSDRLVGAGFGLNNSAGRSGSIPTTATSDNGSGAFLATASSFAGANAPGSPMAPAVGTPKSTTTVGGKALPVPRSQRVSSAFSDGSSSPMMSSIVVGSPAASVTTAIGTTLRPAQHQQPVLSPPSDGRSGLALPAKPPAAIADNSSTTATAVSPFVPYGGGPAQATPSLSTNAVAARVALPSEPPQQPQPVRPESVAKLMTDFSSGATSAEDTVDHILSHYGDARPVLECWFDRCFSVFREEKTRLKTGDLLVVLLSKRVAEVDELRELVFAALQRAVDQNLHEDLKLFRFWAQCILSDTARAILDEGMLEEGLVFVYTHKGTALRSYLTDVGAWYSSVLVGPDYIPAEESAGFVRYRPLSCLHEILGLGYTDDATAIRDAVVALVNFPDVRKSSVEVDIYCSLCAGPANFETLFEKVRTSPRLKNDPTLAAAVINAVLLAEQVCPNGRAYLEDSLPLLLMAVDGPNRREREIAVVAEAQRLIRSVCVGPTHSADARVFMKLRGYRVVSDETIDRAQRFLEENNAATAASAEAEAAQQPPSPTVPANGTGSQSQQPRRIEAAKPRSQQTASPGGGGGGGGGDGGGGNRPRTDSLRSVSDHNSSNSSRNVLHGSGNGGGAHGKGSSAGWRSSNGSNSHTPDAAQLRRSPNSSSGNGSHRGRGAGGGGGGGRQGHPTQTGRAGGDNSASAATATTAASGRGRYNYRSSANTTSNNESSTDSPAGGHKVTGYQGPRARGGGSGAAAAGRKSSRYNYQSSSSYYGYSNSSKASAENSTVFEGKKK